MFRCQLVWSHNGRLVDCNGYHIESAISVGEAPRLMRANLVLNEKSVLRAEAGCIVLGLGAGRTPARYRLTGLTYRAPGHYHSVVRFGSAWYFDGGMSMKPVALDSSRVPMSHRTFGVLKNILFVRESA
jgi:hypothetical protein